MLRSDFTKVGETDEIVFIADNDGRVSITNDAEAVVEHLNSLYPGRRVVYRDTQGDWDELLHENGVFRGFSRFTGVLP